MVQKTWTVGGDLCKSYTFHVKNHELNTSNIIIHKYVLTDKHDLYKDKGFREVKRFKGESLYKQVFAIRESTFKRIYFFIRELNQQTKNER